MENQRMPNEPNQSGRELRDDYTPTPQTPIEREQASNENDDDDDRWDNEETLDDELDDE